MKKATQSIDNLDLFGLANKQEIEQEKMQIEEKRAEEMKLIRCDWFIAVTNTGELFKYSVKVPAKYKTIKSIKLFKCWNEHTADLVLNAFKGAIKKSGYEVPKVKQYKKLAVSSWVRNIQMKFMNLPYGQLTNLYQQYEESLRIKKEQAKIKANQHTYDVEPH